jgi:hypothetical protein
MTRLNSRCGRREYRNPNCNAILQFIVQLPDDLAAQPIPEGRDPSGAAREDIAVKAFCVHRLIERQLAARRFD